jgi:hypothetical protein
MNAWNRFWHDFAIERSRMAVVRFGFFGLLAWDLWSAFIGHAGRYGAGGFNVTQIPWLDALVPLPTPAIVGVGWLFAGFLAARIAMGVAVQTSVRLLAVIYISIYVWNQADSYQHHYFICLLLAVFSFMPAEGLRTAPGEAGEPDTDTPARGRMFTHWSVRMLYVQLSFLYFWTAITKSDPVWLAGSTLDNLVSKPWIRPQILELGAMFGLTETTLFPAMAISVMLGQWFAAMVFQVRKLWILGLFIVPMFHVFVEFIEFDIEYFSYYMIMVDIVVLLPGRAWQWLEGVAARLHAAGGSLWARLWSPHELNTAARIALAVIGAGGAGALTLLVSIEGQPTAAIIVGLATLLAGLGLGSAKPRRPIHVAIGQLIAAALMVTSVQASDSAYDYYRLWAGDLKRRGDLEGAAQRYEQANAATDGPARYYQLGRVYDRLGRADDALAAFETSRKRQEAGLATERRATLKDRTDGEAWADVGDRLMRITDRCTRLAQAYQKRGRTEDAGAAQRCARQSVKDALEAYQNAAKYTPRHYRGHRGVADAQKKARQLR